MFGGAKPSFGTGAGATGFGAFSNTAAATPFGQSAFGKPATQAFGGTPAFGAQPTQPSMFGSTAAPSQPTGGLFGGASTSSAFGGTTAAPTSFGAFSQPPQQTSSIFGSTQAAPNTSLFGQTATSAFGAAKPATLGMTSFGQTPAAQPLFGQQQTVASSSSGFGSFGQTAPATTNVFGSGAASAFGQPQTVVGAGGGLNTGTSLVKYQPTIGTDTLMKGGQTNNVNTKQHCITAMKEYESKSLEELRIDDYASGRKGPQAGSAPGAFGFGSPAAATQPQAGGLFGSPAQQQQPGAGLFGQAGQENKSLFGSSAFGQPAAGSAFGAPAQQNNFLQKPFGATTTSAFGTTTTDAANPFGAKPVGFGQTGGSMFGQAAATSAAPAFGQTSTGFGGFGSTAGTTNQQTPLFGATNQTDPNKPAFGLGTAVSAANPGGFGGFGSPATSTAGGGLFGSKPATSFAAPAFGASSTANTGFGNFSLSNSTAPGAGGGLFNTNMNKPATSAFGGFGTTTSAPLNFNTGNTGGSIFSNTAKPGGGLFGGNTTLGSGTGAAPAGGGLFGAGGATGGFGTSLGGGFGTMGGGNTALSGMGLGASPAQGVVMVPIHQQILSKVTSPYGDTPIFRDLKRNDEVDATRATNPAAQQALLDMNSPHYKINDKDSSAGVRVKAMMGSRNTKSMFDGLEEFDASVEGFSLKPNAKRLVIKPKVKAPMSISEPSTVNQHNSSPAQAAAMRQQSKSFNGAIPNDPQPSNNNGGSPIANRADVDTSRRESWLHPNNLAKVRQHNLQTGMDQSPLNSTLTDLVPRKPLETYKNTQPTRLSVSTIPENPFEDQASSIARRDTFISEHGNESTLSNRSIESEQRLAIELPTTDADPNADVDTEPHPTGIVLTRVGYYTIPQLDDLKSYLAEDGSCVVPDFTVGREGYGNVYFGKEMDVAGLNLDEIVHFRNKEIIIYPDDDNKPPIGSGLNREAQVTLDQVWPVDKTKHEAIKDPQRLLDMDWEAKLRRVCDKNSTRFIEYRPETGSWVFRVKHFSKYGLDDSDEDCEEIPTDAKKAKMAAVEAQATTDKMTLTSLRKAQKISEEAGRSMDPKSLGIVAAANGFRPMDNSVEFMMMDKTQFFQAGGVTDFSMFDAPRNVISPTAPLNREFDGNEPHKVQLMKSSLFIEDSDDEMDSYPLPNRQQQQQQQHRIQNLFTQDTDIWKDAVASESSSEYGRQSPMLAVSSSNSVTSIIRELQSETSSVAAESINPAENKTQTAVLGGLKPFNIVIKPRLAPEKVFASVVPYPRSIAHGIYNHWIADHGFYKGHSFKLSFGPQNTLMVPNTFDNLCSLRELGKATPAAIAFAQRASNDYSPSLLQRLQFNTVDKYENFCENIVPHLEVQLEDCIMHEVEDGDCPWLQSNNGAQLIAKHLAAAVTMSNANSLAAYEESVWSLLSSLWGEHEDLVGQENNSHFVVMGRRNLLSEWLENTLVSTELLSKKVGSNSYLGHMLDLLSCHRVTEACELAFKYDDGNLALILSQLSSGAVVRMLMEEQLFAWQQSKSDKYISLERLKMYMLAAGVPQMQSSHGAINLLEDSSWLTVLALQLWYFTAPTSSITDALLEYDKAYQAEECYADPPEPIYKGKAPFDIERPVYDLRYHLLQLYSRRAHSLEKTLNTITHTSDPMDFRLSWMLLQTLEALGYLHCSALAEAQLHVNFASQLENEGLWHWAIFVQLHIKDRNQRERAVQHTLQQHVSVKHVELNAEEQFVIHQLGVPESWVDYAKSLKAGSMGRRHAQAKYLLKARHWVEAHEIIFQYIAPDAIINNNLEYLYSLLSQFECTEDNVVKVPNWTNQGQIFLDFIDISAKFRQIHNVANNADMVAHWESLRPQLSEICSRISLLPCPTSKHRLCQSEISKCLTCLVHGIRIVCEEYDSCFIVEMAADRLPMPQEFITREQSNLLDEFMQKMLSHLPESETNSQRTLMHHTPEPIT